MVDVSLMDNKPGDLDIPVDPNDTPENYKWNFKCKTFWKYLGPGLLMSIPFFDPGNIAGDLDAGRVAGNSLLWVLL